MLTLTSPLKTWLHPVPAAAKLCLLAAFTVVLFLLEDPFSLALCGLAVLALSVSAGMAFTLHGLRMLRPLWPFLAVVGIWHLWTEDISAGLAIMLRMVAAVAAANLVTMTTRLSDMISVVEGLARPLSPILPPRRLALAIAMVIRFVPVLSEKAERIHDALRARSAKRAGWRAIPAISLAALDDAEHVADALRARGGAE